MSIFETKIYCALDELQKIAHQEQKNNQRALIKLFGYTFLIHGLNQYILQKLDFFHLPHLDVAGFVLFFILLPSLFVISLLSLSTVPFLKFDVLKIFKSVRVFTKKRETLCKPLYAQLLDADNQFELIEAINQVKGLDYKFKGDIHQLKATFIQGKKENIFNSLVLLRENIRDFFEQEQKTNTLNDLTAMFDERHAQSQKISQEKPKCMQVGETDLRKYI